jgi:hypothetical protein
MPNTPPKFFVPDIPAEVEQSVWYHNLASFAQQAVPAENERVYSITYTHNGEEWTSAVGETSRGMIRRTKGRGVTKREVVDRLSDAAKVLAIFPGNPYFVVTDKNIVRQVRSDWANPFMMGRESMRNIVLFSR